MIVTRKFVIIGCLIALCSVSLEAQTLRLSTHDLEPYGYYDEHGRFTGSAVNVLQCALSRMDVVLELTVVPWKRAQNLALGGAVDGFFAASQKADRDAYATMTVPIADQDWIWFWPASSDLTSADLERKQDFVFSSFIGANMQYWLESEGYRTMSALPNTTETLVRMVVSGRVDIGLANRQVLQVLLEQNPGMPPVETALAQERPLGAYIRKDWLSSRPQFMPELNRHILNCRQRNGNED